MRRVRVELAGAGCGVREQRLHELLLVHDSLERLREIDEDDAEVVELRFFGGLELREVAKVLGISRRSVCRRWDSARLWLHRELSA